QRSAGPGDADDWRAERRDATLDDAKQRGSSAGRVGAPGEGQRNGVWDDEPDARRKEKERQQDGQQSKPADDDKQQRQARGRIGDQTAGEKTRRSNATNETAVDLAGQHKPESVHPEDQTEALRRDMKDALQHER